MCLILFLIKLLVFDQKENQSKVRKDASIGGILFKKVFLKTLQNS